MFLPAATAQARLPVLLLSGFLGSGKTTLVNRLLRDQRLANTAVAINEFGEIPLDAQLIEHGADKTVVMANGCLCCNLAGDLEDAVVRVFARAQAGDLPAFERLIIEPSGLADPAPIAQAILRNPVLSRGLRLEGIITTVDAMFGLAQLAAHPEVQKQIAMADTLVITKGDLATDMGALKQRLADLNPVAEVFEVLQGEIDPVRLLAPGFLGGGQGAAARRSAFAASAPHASSHADATIAVSLTADAPLDWRRFEAWLRGVRLPHAEKILRIKGIVNIGGAPVVIHGVHHVLHAPATLAAWPDADRRSRLVFITRGLPRGLIETSWSQAVGDCTLMAAA
jgi:G3E family GTPase